MALVNGTNYDLVYDTDGTGSELLSGIAHITRVLANHCGPYAQNAAIITKAGAKADQDLGIFTKDGITIVRDIEVPREVEHVRQLAKYIGTRIDNACHDGTTTGMMLFLRFLHGTTSAFAQYRNRIPPAHFKIAVNTILQRLSTRIDNDTLTMDRLSTIFAINGADRHQLLRDLAYCQAMIATKSDKNIAEAVAEVVSNSPEDSIEFYTIEKSKKEETFRVMVKTQDSDATFRAILIDKSLRNMYMGLTYRAEGAYLLPFEGTFVSGSEATNGIIQACIHIATELKRDAIIICHGVDNALQNAVAQANATEGDDCGKIVLMTLPQVGNDTLDKQWATAVRLMAGTPDAYTAAMNGHALDAFIPDVTVESTQDVVKISELYPRTPDMRFHPYYTDPALSAAYTNYLEELRDAISQTDNADIVGETAEQRKQKLINIYRQMTSANVQRLVIGGDTHERLALEPDVNDAFGAVTSALTEGFVIGGHHRMLDELVIIRNEAIVGAGLNNSDQLINTVIAELAAQYQQALLDTLGNIYYPPGTAPVDKEHLRISYPAGPGGRFHYGKLKLYTTSAGDPDVIEATSIDGWTSFQEYARSGTLVMQPAAGFKELLRRMMEVVPNYATSAIRIFEG